MGGVHPTVVQPHVVGDPVIDMAIDIVGVILALRAQFVLRRDAIDVHRCRLEQNAHHRIPSQESVLDDKADAVDVDA